MCISTLEITVLVVVISSGVILGSTIELEFVNDYFIERDIRTAVLFTCSVQESLNAMNTVMKNRTVLIKNDFHGTAHIFGKIMTSRYVKVGIYVNYSCEFGKSIMARSSMHMLFNEERVWILVNKNKSLIYDLQKYSLRLDTDLIFAVVEENNTIILHDVYLIVQDLPLVVMYTGYWTEESRLTITMTETKTSRRSDFQGITIKGTGVLSQMNIKEFGKSLTEEQIMDVRFQNHLDILNRFAFIMNMNLAKMHNFTMNVTFVDFWGIRTNSGEYTGMLGEIVSGRSELGLSTMIMNISLINILDFSFPIWKFRPMFILRSPNTFGTYKALLIPFKTEVWVIIICLITFLVIALTFIKHFHVHIESGVDIKDMDLHKSWSENLVTVVGAFSTQGLTSCSNRIPERIILYTSLVVGMLIYTFYNSMVVTSLLQSPPSNIRTCDDLLASGMSISITNQTYFMRYFQMSNDELTQKLHKRSLETTGFMSPEEGVALVKSKDLAFYGEEAALYPVINDIYSNNDVCRLVELTLVTPYYLPCPYRKGSSLRQFVKSGLHLMRERGIVTRERRQWHRSKTACQGQNDVPSIQLHTLLVAYVILFSGIWVSTIIFIIEILSRKVYSGRTKKKRRKQNLNDLLNNYNENNFHN